MACTNAEFEAYLATTEIESAATSINYAHLGQAITAVIPPPPLATDMATAVVRATPTPEQYAAAITAAMPTSSAADSFQNQTKLSDSNYKVLQKPTQWMRWCQSTVTTGHYHGVAEVFDPTYLPGDTAAQALFEEQKKFMFSVFAVTLKESSAASLYDTYTVEGTINYGDSQMIWHDLIQLFTKGQAGKALQHSLEHEVDDL